MSTRATYEFYYDEDLLATFYIHNDGYPKGARTYFKKAWDDFNLKEYLEDEKLEKYEALEIADRFYRANENAELSITDDSITTDLEYTYKIQVNTGILTVVEYIYKKGHDVKWCGSLMAFIEKAEIAHGLEIANCL